MKKIIFLILAITLLVSVNIIVYGQEINQSAERSEGVILYLNKMQTIADLRIQTQAAVNSNNEIVKQIRDLINDSNRISVENKVNQIKVIHQTSKDLLNQAKIYSTQRADLRNQWQDALRIRDTAKAAANKEQINELTKNIEDIRIKIKENNVLINPLIEEVKTYREANKSKIEQIKLLISKTAIIQDKIASEKLTKDKLWQDFSNNVKEKNYTQSLIAMDSIISQKQGILVDIQSKNVILNEILTIQESK